jgi:hypothetical protein
VAATGAPNRRPAIRTLLPATLWVLAAAACARDVPRGIEAALHPPTLKVSAEPSWTGLEAGDAVVAEAGGLPIPADRLRRALLAAGPGASPRAVLDLLVDRELAAQQAAREAPGGTLEAPLNAYRSALVARYLSDRFVEELPPAKVPKEDLEALFKIPQVWARYNHFRIFRIQDYQWICCGGGPSECGSEAGTACFAEGATAMARLADALQKDPPDSVDIPLLTERWRSVAPRLTYQAYDFAWDEEHQMQKGSVVFDEAVVETVLKTPPGRFAPKAARSRFGWHVPYVKESQPPARGTLEDPWVRDGIARFFWPKFQQRRLAETLVGLVPVHGFRMLEQAFPMGPPAGTRPKYDAAAYPEALSEAMEAATRSKEEDPL